MLKNAKDSCAAEALEIATYTALARLARAAGDAKTERLAASISRRRAADARPASEGDPAADRRRGAGGVRRERLLRRDRDRRRRRAARGRRHGQAHARKGAARPSAPPARPARSRASRAPRARSRAPWRPQSDLAIANYDSLSATRFRPSSPSSPRSTWPRSTPTSARTRTAPRSPAGSTRCRRPSRGPATTS